MRIYHFEFLYRNAISSVLNVDPDIFEKPDFLSWQLLDYLKSVGQFLAIFDYFS